MPNFQLPKGQYTTISIALFKYDLDTNGLPIPDTTTPVTVSASSALLVEPVNSGAGNRDFYVSVKPTEINSQVNASVTLTAVIPADGLGAGAPVKTFSVTQGFDTVVPVDHRAVVLTPPTTLAPLPHP